MSKKWCTPLMQLALVTPCVSAAHSQYNKPYTPGIHTSNCKSPMKHVLLRCSAHILSGASAHSSAHTNITDLGWLSFEHRVRI